MGGAATTLDALRGRIGAILASNRVPGASIVLAGAGGVIWAGGVGVADRATGRPVTAATPFRLGSVSKSLTALAAMRLVESGRLSLDARLRSVAPDVSFENPWEASHPVLVAQLLEHTAGFEMVRFNDDVDDSSRPRSLLEALAVNPATRQSRWPPGTRMSYSNEGYLAAGRVLETVTGRSFDEVLQDQVLGPLGMGTAAFRLTPQLRATIARGYRSDGTAWDYREDMMRPAANLLASADDMARYLRLWLGRGEVDGQRLLSTAGIDRIEARRTLPYAGPEQQYGLGSETEQYDGHVAHGHAGTADGFRASLRYFPREGVGWALALNADSDQARDDVEGELAGYLMRGAPAPPRAATVLSGGVLAGLAGFYRDVTALDVLRAPITAILGGEDFEVRGGALWERAAGDGGVSSLVRSPPWQRLSPCEGGGFCRDGETISSLYFARGADGGRVLVTPAGYLERGPGWLVAVERALLLGALLCLLGAVVAAPLWLLRAAFGGPPRGHLGIRLLPAAAALAAACAYGLFSRNPQPLGEMNATTVAVFVLS
ncbi:MAG TPA: serine hydrolase domain-containing protein, partial [Candidatus Dormibacteraeota bacterium]